MLLAPMGVSEGLQRPVAYVGMFFLALLITAILSAMIANSIVSPHIVRVDRTLGAAFGILRGLVIVLILAIIGSITVYVDESWWQNSFAVQAYEPWVGSIRDWLSDILTAGQAVSAGQGTNL